MIKQIKMALVKEEALTLLFLLPKISFNSFCFKMERENTKMFCFRFKFITFKKAKFHSLL